MSSKYKAGQFAPPNGGIMEALPNSDIVGFFRGVPTASIGGYLPGALSFDITNGNWYKNTGTITSATWLLIGGTAGSNNLISGGSALTVTQALHDGRTIKLDTATGTAVTLPAMTGTGAKYRFVNTVTMSGGNTVITATAAHLFGSVTQNTDTANGTSGFTSGVIANAAGVTTITLNGTTQGGRKGDWVEIEDVATSIGIVRGNLNASGTEATPFA